MPIRTRRIREVSITANRHDSISSNRPAGVSIGFAVLTRLQRRPSNFWIGTVSAEISELERQQRKNTTQRQHQGFTLIELVIVIVILGILSAFALPQFANLGGDARRASLEGAAGSVASAASIAHSVWLARSKPGGQVSQVSLDGVEVRMSPEGYPTRQAGSGLEGIKDAAQLDSNDFTLGNIRTIGSDRVVDIGLADGPAGCVFTYSAVSGTVSGLDSADCE